MILKIATDVSTKLNTTISKDFDDMVGLEAHLEKMKSLLHLDDEDEAMIVGICGTAGIGKSTIARALHSRLSNDFQLTCFMENIRESYNSGIDEYGSKLSLQEQLLSKILNQNGMRIYHLGAVQERCDQKVFIILDDVDDLQQLEALANKTNWFGPGSRVIVTTEDKELLEKHDINHIYHVDFSTNEDARKIFCRYAFRRSLAPNGFENLSERVTNICGNLPLGLSVMGSSLRGKREDDWESILLRLENSLDRKIEGVLRVGYDKLHKYDQLLFLCIAFFFNYQDGDSIKAMLGDCVLDVKLGLKTLAYRSLIQISTEGNIMMHKLLQQVGREAVQRQDPRKRQFLTDTHEICDFLENEFDNRSIMGISFDIATLPNDVYISAGSFKRLRNLRFLNIYKNNFDANYRLHVPEDMDFPPQLKLLHLVEFPGKCFPRTFKLEYLVELILQENELEKLWDGIQPLTNLKKLDLLGCFDLKELSDLSNATNLETLNLAYCDSLVEIPSSIGNLQKLKFLEMEYCTELEFVPTNFNLTSLESVEMDGCSKLIKFPDIFGNIRKLTIADTMVEDLPESISLWSRLQILKIYGSVSSEILKTFLEKRGTNIERIPDCIKDLHELEELEIHGCPKLSSLPELPSSLRRLTVSNCESLETLISFSFDSPIEYLCFTNCFKLGQEARSVITQQSRIDAVLPGRSIPAEFNHRAIGNSLTIPSEAHGFRICIVISPKQLMLESALLFFLQHRLNGFPIYETLLSFSKIQTEHLYICEFESRGNLLDSELLLEFITISQDINIIECGLQILTYKTNTRKNRQGIYEPRSEQMLDEDVDQDISDGSYESCSEQLSEDKDHEDLSEGSFESCLEQSV